MMSPEGNAFPEKPGCILIVEPERRLVWTDGLGPLFRPNAEAFMTAEITMEALADGTRYRALVRHKIPKIERSMRTWAFSNGGGLLNSTRRACRAAIKPNKLLP